MHNAFSYTVRAAALMEKIQVSHIIMSRSLLLTAEHAWAPSLVVHRGGGGMGQTHNALGWAGSLLLSHMMCREADTFPGLSGRPEFACK